MATTTTFDRVLGLQFKNQHHVRELVSNSPDHQQVLEPCVCAEASSVVVGKAKASLQPPPKSRQFHHSRAVSQIRKF